jgi:hypothetical protein
MSGDRPALLVVIAATESAQAARLCAESVGPDFDVVVAFDPARVRLRQNEPGFRSIAGPIGSQAHVLRALGAASSSAPVVAFTEDSCRLGPGWCEHWLSAFADPQVLAATGPVQPGSNQSSTDLAVFLCEYALFLTGLRSLGRLAGNNFAVRRDVLPGDGRPIHECRIPDRLAERGGKRVWVSAATATHVRSFTLSQAIRDRLRFGWGYGRLRASEAGLPRRAVQLVLGPLILAKQVIRLPRCLIGARRSREFSAESWVIAIMLLAAWSVAEWLGWARGPGADASRSPDAEAARWPGPTVARVPSEPRDRKPSPAIS